MLERGQASLVILIVSIGDGDEWASVDAATWDTVYHKLSIVIGASTHAYAFAYTSDPQVMTQGS